MLLDLCSNCACVVQFFRTFAIVFELDSRNRFLCLVVVMSNAPKLPTPTSQYKITNTIDDQFWFCLYVQHLFIHMEDSDHQRIKVSIIVCVCLSM